VIAVTLQSQYCKKHF